MENNNNNNIDAIIQEKIDGLHKRSSLLIKRIRYLTLYLLLAPILFAIILSYIFSNISNNFYNEKNDLQQYKKELREDIGKTEAQPILNLFGLNGKPLENQVISIDYQIKDQDYLIPIQYIARNEGKKTTGKMAIKIYTKRLTISSSISTDEPNFKFESYINSDDIKPSEVPGGGYSLVWTTRLFFKKKEDITIEKDDILLKIYYGNDKMVSARFKIFIKNL